MLESEEDAIARVSGPLLEGQEVDVDRKLLHGRVLHRVLGLPGTDVMIFKIFSPKNVTKKLAILFQNIASFYKKMSIIT
jgi:hypothetical protein